MSPRQAAIDQHLLDATGQAISRWGLREVTLERIAAEAGLSRATMYRRGVTRDELVDALTVQAADTYQRAVLPALAQPGSARDRLAAALEALCRTADEHLELLGGLFLAGGEVFHQPGPDAMVIDVFAEPFERLLRDGALDGTLRPLPPTLTATVLFNLVGWGYIHLRAAHQWQPEITARTIIDLLFAGLDPQP